MSASGISRFGVFAAIAVAIVPPASAQHVVLDAPGIIGKQVTPPPAPPRVPLTVWPRLDPGAVLCRTAEDLDRHAANMIARVSGGDTQPADCRLIAQPTGIQIVSREGPGRTRVTLTAPDKATGWTDAWLPDKAPPTR